MKSMTRWLWNWVHKAAFACCVLAVFSSPIRAQQDEVWQLEEDYWRYVKAGDIESYMVLWHEDFVGWPCGAPSPGGKANVGDWVQVIRDEGITITYDLGREAVQYFGDLAIAHYSSASIRRYADGRVEARVSKLTHTWMKTENRWQIIGGMCGPLETMTP